MNWEAIINNSVFLKLGAAALEIVVGFILGPLVKKLIMRMEVKGVDTGVLTFTASFASIFIRLMAVIIALTQIGVDMSVAVGAFSAMGLGISLALKENMANVAGGLQILITKPFRVGDYIAVGSDEGTVKEIQIMFCVLQTFNNQEIVVPNSILVSTQITNYSAFPTRRIVLKVPVTDFGDYTGFREKIQNLMESEDRVLKDPAPKTVVGGFTESGNGMTINLVCYTSVADYWDVYYSLIENVQKIRSELKLNPPIEYVKVISNESV